MVDVDFLDQDVEVIVKAWNHGFASVVFPLAGAGTGGFGEQAALGPMLEAFAGIDSPKRALIVRFWR